MTHAQIQSLEGQALQLESLCRRLKDEHDAATRKLLALRRKIAGATHGKSSVERYFPGVDAKGAHIDQTG